MSQTAFKISEGLIVQSGGILVSSGDITISSSSNITFGTGASTKSLNLDQNTGVLVFNGYNLATEGYVDDAIANISIPPAYITSVSDGLTVGTDGVLALNTDVTLVTTSGIDGNSLAVHAGAGLTADMNGLKVYIDESTLRFNSVNTKILEVNTDAIATQTYVGSQGFLLSSDLSGYLTSSDASSTYQTQSGLDTAISGLGYITSSALSGYATESYVGSQGFLLSSDLSGYATESYVGSQGFLTSADLSGYATESYVGSQGFLTSADLSGYATETYVGSQGFITSSGQYIQSVGSSLSVTANELNVDLSGLATETYVGSQGFITSSALTGYATESYVGTQISNLVDGAPDLLNTLNELAAAINDDANYASTLTTALGNKQNTLTAGNGITIVSDTVALDPNVVITAVSLTNAETGVSASSDVFGNTTNTTYAMGSDVTVGTLATGTVAADMFLQILDNAGNSRTSKLTAVFNGGSAPIWTEYGVVDSGTTIAATVSFDSSKHIIVNVTGSGTYAVRGVVTNLN